MRNRKVWQFIVLGLLSLVFVVLLGQQVYAHNIVLSIDRQLTQQLIPITPADTLTDEDKLPLLVSSQYDNELLELINQQRVNNGVSRLNLLSVLSRAAQPEAETSSFNLQSIADYLTREGHLVMGMPLGYVHAGGPGWTPSNAVEYLMNPTFNQRNIILGSTFTEVGFGVATRRGTTFYVAVVTGAKPRNSLSTNISGQWTYRAGSFGPECSINSTPNESTVTINQNGNQFTSSGGISVESRLTSNDAIGNGSITGSQIQSSTTDRYVSWSGAINPDANTINGTANCVMGGGGTGRGSFPFTLTRRSSSSPNQTNRPPVTPPPSSTQTPSNSPAPPFPQDAGPNIIRPDFRRP